VERTERLRPYYSYQMNKQITDCYLQTLLHKLSENIGIIMNESLYAAINSFMKRWQRSVAVPHFRTIGITKLYEAGMRP